MHTAVDCLVTGATGFLGSLVVRLLLEKGASVRCLVRQMSRLGRVPDWPGTDVARLETIHGNLLSPADVDRAVEGVRVVYHLAAESRGYPATIFAGTVLGSKNLLEAIVRARPERVILVSSINVCGLANTHGADGVTEDCLMEQAPEKRDVYTHAKIWQERLFREYLTDSGIGLTVLRPGHIYGPGRSHLPARLGLLLGNVLLAVNHDTLLPITYVENCAAAVVFCGRNREAANQIYNVIDDDVPTGGRYLELVRRMNAKIRVLRSPFVALSALCYLNGLAHRLSAGQVPLVLTKYKAACSWRSYRFSSEKLKNLGWKQPISTRDALERTFFVPRLTGESVRVPLKEVA